MITRAHTYINTVHTVHRNTHCTHTHTHTQITHKAHPKHTQSTHMRARRGVKLTHGEELVLDQEMTDAQVPFADKVLFEIVQC